LKLKVHTQIFMAIILGVLVGLVLGEKTSHLKLAGDMFIRLLRMIIIPLILASMVAGIVSLGDIRRLGRIGLKTLIYYMASTILAVAVGLVLVNLMRPGTGVAIPAEEVADASDTEVPSILSIATDIVPTNLFEAMAQDKVLSIILWAWLSAARKRKANHWSFSSRASTRS